MNRILLYIFVVIIIFSAKISFADSGQINAGVLPSVWYSSLNVNDQDSIKIFGAVQNHSDTDFSGVISIFVDDKLNSSVNFISNNNSLTEVSIPWKATEGKHSLQLKITKISFADTGTTTAFSTSSLLSFESDATTLSITKPITLQTVTDSAKEIALNTVDKIDTAANTLADKIDALKKPEVISSVATPSEVTSAKSNSIAADNTGPASTKTADKMVGKVLGAETKYQASSTNSGIFKYPVVTTIYNKIIDFLSMIVRNWQITLFVIIVLFIIIKYFIL